MSAGADTRERILAVASELFVDQGYDGTSLREIAERLGFTKAALYYHFASKEQILDALLAPAQLLIQGLHERLSAARSIDEWAEALEWVVSEVFSNGDLFRIMARNRHVIETHLKFNLVEGDDMKSHALLHESIEEAAAAIASDVGEQVRMIAALGAVTGFDDWAPTLMQTSQPEVLGAELVAVTRRILGLRARARR